MFPDYSRTDEPIMDNSPKNYCVFPLQSTVKEGRFTPERSRSGSTEIGETPTVGIKEVVGHVAPAN